MDDILHKEQVAFFPTPSKIVDRLYEYSSEVEYKETKVKNVFSRRIRIFHTASIEDKFRFQLITIDFSVKGNQSESTSLIKKISSLFDNVVVSVGTNMRIEKVNNLNDLFNRWQSIKEGIRKTYKGFAVENYLNVIDYMLANPRSLIEFLHEYKMFGLFFNGYMRDIPLERFVILDESGIELIAKRVSYDIECIQLKTILNIEKESIQGEYYYESSCLLDATVKILGENKNQKYKLLCFGLRKNL